MNLLKPARWMFAAIFASSVWSGVLTTTEIDKIEAALEITLSGDERAALATAAKPDVKAPWRVAAEARIEQHRKADLDLVVLDARGEPLPGASVEIRQVRRHGFRFTGVLNLKRFVGKTAMGISTDRYKELALLFFDSFGLDNGLKPKLRNGNEEFLPEYFSWLAANGVESRGHTLIWPGNPSNDHMTPTVRAIVDAYNAETDPSQRALIKTNLKNTVAAEIEEWASLWPVHEWDVINEAIGNREIQDILGEEVMADWFRIARDHAVQEDCRLMINEFQIISARSDGSTYSSRSTEFKRIIDELIANDAPISGIGFQSRYKFERMDPNMLYARLEEFAAYGLPMVGTEFHVPDRLGSFEPSDVLRAQITEEVMTTYFSHPLVDGLACWSFLDDRPEEASLLNDDGSVNLQGLVWYYLTHIRYFTDASVALGTDGRGSLRAFKGAYEVTVRDGESEFTTTIDLEADGEQVIATDLVRAGKVVTVEVPVLEDTYAQSNQPTKMPGEESFLNLRWSGQASDFIRVAYLKFDLDTYPYPIQTATLHLYSDNEVDAVNALAVADDDWDESSLNWANRPATGAVMGVGAANASSWFTIDLAGQVSAPGTLSLALDELGNTFHKLSSSEGAFPPYLEITYIVPDTDEDGIADDEDTDDDGDLLPDAFEELIGTDSLVSGDGEVDHDLDGLDTLLEFALALNPKSLPGSVDEGLVLSPDSSGLQIIYQIRDDLEEAGITLLFQYSDDLTHWTRLQNAEDFDAAGLLLESSMTDSLSDDYGPFERRTLLISGVEKPGFLRFSAGPR